jgi:hypothetical protein
MAPDSASVTSPSTIAGIFWFGLMAVNSGVDCSPLARFSFTIS